MPLPRSLVATSLSIVAIALALGAAPPPTPKRPVTDEHHGIRIVDDYRWLESWDEAEVKQWSDAQNDHARKYLDGIAFVPALRERVTELENAVGPRYLEIRFASGIYFASKSVPGKQQPMIVALGSLTDVAQERVIIDPNELDAGGGTSFDWFHPSPDGKLVAVSLSSGGSESGDARIFEVATGKERAADRVPRVNGGTAGGSLAWDADSSGFYYSRYPRAGERAAEDLDFYTQVYHHALGTAPEKDSYQVGKDYPKIAEIQIEVSRDGRWVLTNVQNGDGGEFIQDLRTPSGEWIRLSTWADRIVEAKFGAGTAGKAAVYLVSRKDAPMGKVLRMELTGDKRPALAEARELVAEQADASIETDFASRSGITITDSRLFVLYQVGGPNELRAFGLGTLEKGAGAIKPLGGVASLPISTVQHVEALGDNAVAYENESFITPPAWFTLKSVDGTSGQVQTTALRQSAPPHMPELAVRREMATSKDGTKIPVNIVARKDVFAAFDSHGALKAPTVVWGYGGYGVNETPGFSRRTILLTEQGGIYAFTNIRGGGEYGERWHTEGNLTKKQNVFDDFQAACTHLMARGYTTREKLAIFGGSNGGLLMGATFTQRPDLCKAVVSSVGIYDMLRVELSANGAFNVTEFGTVRDKCQFDALYAYSPYHHVKPGVKYPVILFLTGANDPRVDPMQSRKMTALLQQAQASVSEGSGGPSPVYLRTSANTGHGMGTPLAARIEQTVDTFAFLFDQLGVRYVPAGGR